MSRPEPTLAPRSERLATLERDSHQVVVVGGGITGAGIALDLALRGLRVVLVERGDWAGATSSASSRLVHGGLRYLEQFELGLVRESCRERRLLLRNAGGLVWPERFLFPLRRGDRLGALRVRLGLWLYTALSLPSPLGWPGSLSRTELERALPGSDPRVIQATGTYLDGATDDARLTLAVVLSAARAGALVSNRIEVTGVDNGERPRVRLRDLEQARSFDLSCDAVVLAAGPFTDRLRQQAGLDDPPGKNWMATSRGTHLLVPRQRLPTDGAVILPSAVDGRIVFLLPRPRQTVIGTTDVDASPDQPIQATRAEVSYLLETANHLVPRARLSDEDVLCTWAGLRPLLASDATSPSQRSREERIERSGRIYTIAGGKLTGYRAMAESLAHRLTADLRIGRPGRRSPTRSHRLCYAAAESRNRPDWSRWTGRLAQGDELLEAALRQRYGAAADEVLAYLDQVEDGRQRLDPETCVGEIDWAVEREDCRSIEDFLLRRTDAGYDSRQQAGSRGEVVLARLTRLLGFDAARQQLERQRWCEKLDDMHAWRGQEQPGTRR